MRGRGAVARNSTNLLVRHNYLDNRASFTFTPEALAIDTGIAPTTAGNPLDDITAVRRVRFVMKSGAVVRNVAR